MQFYALILAKTKVKNPFQFTLYRHLKSAMSQGLFQKNILKSEKFVKTLEDKYLKKIKKPVNATVQIVKSTPDDHPLQVKFTLQCGDEWATVEYFKGKTVKWHYEVKWSKPEDESEKQKNQFKKAAEALNKALLVIVKKEKKAVKP